MKFNFFTAPQIIFGSDRLSELPNLFPDFGQRCLLVVGFTGWENSSVPDLLTQAQISWCPYHIDREPTVNIIDEGVRLARELCADFIIGLGGGSAIDGAKAIAAMYSNPGVLLDYLEVIGEGKPLQISPLPTIAIPTTAGTGAEVTRNAVIGSTEHDVKVSLRSNSMIPKVALIDPKLTLHLPQNVTAGSGLDALTQVIEPYVSESANELTDALCLQAIRVAAEALPLVYHHGEQLSARESMAFVSLVGGIALTNARLGAVHGFAGPFGGMYHAPHGAICGRLLPTVMRVNIRNLRGKAKDNRALGRYQQVAAILTGDTNAEPEDGAKWVSALVEEFNIPRLGTYGLTTDDFGELVQKALAASSMKGNPIRLSEAECLEILMESI